MSPLIGSPLCNGSPSECGHTIDLLVVSMFKLMEKEIVFISLKIPQLYLFVSYHYGLFILFPQLYLINFDVHCMFYKSYIQPNCTVTVWIWWNIVCSYYDELDLVRKCLWVCKGSLSNKMIVMKIICEDMKQNPSYKMWIILVHCGCWLCMHGGVWHIYPNPLWGLNLFKVLSLET